MKQRFAGCWALLSLAALLSGCETMTPTECKTANWRELGLRDGLKGETMALLAERTSDCAKAGVRADDAQYLVGREQGLLQYCRLENAVPLGLSGGAYSGVCSPMVDVEFRRRHQAARAVYDWRSRVNDLVERSERLQRRLRDADRDEEKQLKATDKDDERKRIRKEFDERRNSLRQDLRDLDRGTRHARDELRWAEDALNRLY